MPAYGVPLSKVGKNVVELPEVKAIPYAQLECVFNHKNLWVPRFTLDPTKITYDFDDEVPTPAQQANAANEPWERFVEPRMKSLDMPAPFYAAKRLATKVAPDRLRSMEAQIVGELIAQAGARFDAEWPHWRAEWARGSREVARLFRDQGRRWQGRKRKGIHSLPFFCTPAAPARILIHFFDFPCAQAGVGPS